MAEGIRLELSLADKFTGELRRHKESMTSFGKHVEDTKFKFQYAWAQMEDHVKRFSVSSAGQKIKQLERIMSSGLKKMADGWDRLKMAAVRSAGGIGSVLGRIRQSLTSLPALIATSAVAIGFGAAIKQGLAFNSTVESLSMQFEVLTKDATRAKNIMRELVGFAARTPFELNEVAGTAKTLMAFGLTGTEWLRRVGDAAAAANQPITEMAGVFGKIAAGAYGEAFQRLAETGIATRKMLEGYGLKFDKGGSYVGTVEKALSAISSIVDTRFAGMMDKMSQTWQGKLSTLKDGIGMVLGVATGQLFDNLKPRLDKVDRILQRIATGGAAAAVGERISKPIIAMLDTVLKWLSDPGKLFGKFFEWGDRVKLVFTTIWAGIKWVWDFMKAFINWTTDGFEKLSLTATRALSKIGLADWDKAQQAKLDAVSLKFGEAGDKLRDAFSASGALDHWTVGSEKIKSTIYDIAMLARGASSSMSSLLTGKSTGDGLNQSPSYARTPSMAAPSTPFLAANQARLAAEKDLQTALFAMRLQNFDLVQQQMDLLQQQWVERQTEIFSEYYANLANLGQDLFVDSMSTLILEDAENMKLALDDVWDGVKTSFVRMSLGMVATWIRGRIKMALAEKLINSASAKSQAEAAIPKIAALKLETGASAGAAAAAYHASLAWLGPFGSAAASGLIKKMGVDIAIASAFGSLKPMRTGGVVPGGGSGNEDNRMTALSGGEGVLTKRAVDAYGGRQFVDDLNNLRLSMGGGGSVNFAPVITGGGQDRAGLLRDIEDEIVPILERLARQRRFRMVLS